MILKTKTGAIHFKSFNWGEIGLPEYSEIWLMTELVSPQWPSDWPALIDIAKIINGDP